MREMRAAFKEIGARLTPWIAALAGLAGLFGGASSAPAQALRKNPLPNLPAGGAGVTDIQMLVPGFAVRALPLELRNINALRYRDDGKLVALTFDGRVYLLSDSDGDGLEDKADIFYDPGRVHLSLNIALTPRGYPAGQGVFIARKGNLALELDTDGDGRADKEIVVADKWETPQRFPGGASDTIGVALDRDGNVYFGLGAANSQNGYLLENGVASYRLGSERGTLLRVPPDFSRREVVATGIRAAFGMAFNAAGDLFATDQEGATWMANGNPYDELLHLQPGRHYGFPPRHPKHLPNVIDEPSVIDFGPQHQSTCGLFFNEPYAGAPVFGPDWWRGDAFVAGEARGKLYRVKLVKTPSGYVGRNQLIAVLGWLTIDQCVSPRGELVVSVHSGPPDWGTGALGTGRLFKIVCEDSSAPQPVLAYSASPTERHVLFDRPLAAGVEKDMVARTTMLAGAYVREGDRFETFRPGYRAVDDQQAAPRTRLALGEARISEDRRALILTTNAHPVAEAASIDIDAWPRSRPAGKEERTQQSVLSVGADATGVEAKWTAAEGGDTWTGWLPHFDLQVARELTSPSHEHDQLWKLITRRGTLVLRGQLDLWSMLRPAVQPGERLDFTLPAERVSVGFALKSGAAPRVTAGGAKREAIETSDSTTRIARHAPREQSFLPIEVSLETGEGRSAPELHVFWYTAEDARPRALSLRRVLMPWAVPPAPALPPKTPPELAGGDWQLGKQLFAACAMCHGVNSEGSRVGPDLSNLVHRDYSSVLKDIVEPSAAIHPDHIAYVIALKNGETRTAVLLEDNSDHVLLAMPGAAPEKLPKRAIAMMTASTTSLMPAGLDQALGPKGLKDLLTFLMLPPPTPSFTTPP